MRGHWFLPLLLGRIFLLILQPFTVAQKAYNVTIGGINLDSEEIVLFDPQYVVRVRLFIIQFPSTHECLYTIRFIMKQYNHSLVQSTWERPCELKERGFETALCVLDNIQCIPSFVLTQVSASLLYLSMAFGQFSYLDPGVDGHGYHRDVLSSNEPLLQRNGLRNQPTYPSHVAILPRCDEELQDLYSNTFRYASI